MGSDQASATGNDVPGNREVGATAERQACPRPSRQRRRGGHIEGMALVEVGVETFSGRRVDVVCDAVPSSQPSPKRRLVCAAQSSTRRPTCRAVEDDLEPGNEGAGVERAVDRPVDAGIAEYIVLVAGEHRDIPADRGRELVRDTGIDIRGLLGAQVRGIRPAVNLFERGELVATPEDPCRSQRGPIAHSASSRRSIERRSTRVELAARSPAPSVTPGTMDRRNDACPARWSQDAVNRQLDRSGRPDRDGLVSRAPHAVQLTSGLDDTAEERADGIHAVSGRAVGAASGCLPGLVSIDEVVARRNGCVTMVRDPATDRQASVIITARLSARAQSTRSDSGRRARRQADSPATRLTHFSCSSGGTSSTTFDCTSPKAKAVA